MKCSCNRFLFATTATAVIALSAGRPGFAADMPGVEPIPEPPLVQAPPPQPVGEPVYKGEVKAPLLEMNEPCEGEDCPAALRGRMLDNSTTERLPVGKNTEKARAEDAPDFPFVISVDGQVVDENGNITDEGAFGVDPDARPVDRQRKTDVDLSAVDIQVKFDGLDQTPLLNVSTVPMRRTYRPGEPVRFYATANYTAFISRAEIRIFDAGNPRLERPVSVLPVRVNSEASWVMPSGREGEYSYVLRVYDAKGRFDETVPRTIARTRGDLPRDSGDAVAPGDAEDNTAFRNIPVDGGAVTIHGRNVPAGYGIVAFNRLVPIDAKGSFVTQQILPPGDHVVDIAVDGASKSGGLYFSRDVYIPENDWFYVALADITLGQRQGDDGIEAVRSGDYDEVWTRGRLAFYLRGKIKGKYLLTAALDTSEEKLANIFDNLDERDPRELLRRIDPDKYYPVYGDDSKTVDDAPSNGRFYVRLERGESHVMWGNYKTKIYNTHFMQTDRGLYGANLVYRSPGTTRFGEHNTDVTLYAAQPETLPQRDEFLGTGGSSYFLKRQDLVNGSETLFIEYRDETSGRVVERRALVYGEDYRIDYVHGVVILDEPLSQNVVNTGPVREGALGGYEAFLVVQYEYEPRASEVDGYVYGGRFQQWIKDRVRIGATGMNEETGTADQRTYGVDVRVRRSERTYVEGEVAYSEGPGFGTAYSTDGGFTITDEPTAGRPGHGAMAWRFHGEADLRDFKYAGFPGRFSAYYEEMEAGFSSITDQVTTLERRWGTQFDLPLTSDVALDLSYDEFQDGAGARDARVEAAVEWRHDAYWKASFGVAYSELFAPGAVHSGKSGYNGSRLDAGVRVDHRLDDYTSVYGFAQASVDRSGDIADNDRYGIGGTRRLTEKLGVEGEVSWGPRGVGGLAGLTYDPTAEDHYYVGYRLDPDRAFDGSYNYELVGVDRGSIVAGVKKRLDETISVYSEDNFDLFGRRNSLAQTYGVLYTPDAQWTVDAGLEAGLVDDDRINPDTGAEYSDFERYVGSLGVGYNDEDLGVGVDVHGEARVDRSDDDTRNVNTYAVSAGGRWQHDESGRVLGNVDAVISDSQEGTYYDGDYVEASLGYAYRPVVNDRVNMLVRYTFVHDLPGNDTISGVTGTTDGPMQRSHIVAADVIYDLLPWLSVGGKYAMRFGQIKYRGTDGTTKGADWEESNAHLGILRTDIHIVRNWDALLEARAFYLPDIESTEIGALAGIYRHFGNNFKAGIGYNFGRFSDDLRDLTLDDSGLNVNLVAKF